MVGWMAAAEAKTSPVTVCAVDPDGAVLNTATFVEPREDDAHAVNAVSGCLVLDRLFLPDGSEVALTKALPLHLELVAPGWARTPVDLVVTKRPVTVAARPLPAAFAAQEGAQALAVREAIAAWREAAAAWVAGRPPDHDPRDLVDQRLEEWLAWQRETAGDLLLALEVCRATHTHPDRCG